MQKLHSFLTFQTENNALIVVSQRHQISLLFTFLNHQLSSHMNLKTICLLIFISINFEISQAQDSFHTDLANYLSTNYQIDNPSYPISDSEEYIRSNMYIYGDATRGESTIEGYPFDHYYTIQVNSVGSNVYDAGTGIRTLQGIAKDDLLLVSFWGRSISEASNLQIFVENSTSFNKELYGNMALTNEWVRYFFAAKASENYTAGNMTVGIQLANAVQTFELGGFTLVNYGQNVGLNQVPNYFDPSNYDGSDPSASWRTAAQDRIETLRKADLSITITDLQGIPIEGAQVKIDMQQHQFGFGSAVVPCRFQGNRCYNNTYVDKINNIDGAGHRFNEVVTENALKWDGWEEEWIGTPEETVNAIQYLNNLDIEVRGHTLIWPGWELMPNDIGQNRNNIDYIKNRIFNRIDDMLLHPQLKDAIVEWDVINEITFVRDLEYHMAGRPGYPTGREIYKEIFDRASATSPSHINYINDYATLSNGGENTGPTERFKSFLDELFDAGAKIDGIGMQSHIGAQLTSINKVEDILDEFYQRYKVPIKITEFDIERNIDDETAADYMGDFMTMVFSHPSVEAFIMWGFWDGNHWKENAPMFDLNWNLKPAGQRFIDLVYGDWWTRDEGISNTVGQVSFRPFKGQHSIEITVNGKTYNEYIDINKDENITLSYDVVSATYELSNEEYSISPNPSSSQISISFPEEIDKIDVIITDMKGSQLYSERGISHNNQIKTDLASGQYIVTLNSEDGMITKLLQILN